jgi:hypothetical protein
MKPPQTLPEERLGGTRDHLTRGDLLKLFVETFGPTGYRRIRLGNSAKAIDREYTRNEAFWQDAKSNRLFEGMRVELDGFQITEWLPYSPGRYFSSEASRNRELAEKFWDDSRHEFTLTGKEAMVLGGVGCLRLLSKNVDSVPLFILGATSTGVCHQGIPVLLTEEVYRKSIEPIKETGSYFGKFSGTIRGLPEPFHLEFGSEIPKYCIFVDEKAALRAKRKKPDRMPLVTAAITFDAGDHARNQEHDFDMIKKGWSYYSFSPDAEQLGLKEAVHWLSDYAHRYSGMPRPSILSDFDEHFDHFPGQVEFPQARILKGQIDETRFMIYAQRFGITIQAKEFYMDASTTKVNVINSVVQGNLVVAKQVIDSFKSDNKNPSLAADLENLRTTVEQLVKQLPPADQEQVSRRLKSLTEEATSPNPDKKEVKGLGQKIIDIAGKVTSMAGPVAAAVQAVLKIFGA